MRHDFSRDVVAKDIFFILQLLFARFAMKKSQCLNLFCCICLPAGTCAELLYTQMDPKWMEYKYSGKSTRAASTSDYNL